MGSKSTRDVLDLLDEKESELQAVKEKYEKLKNTSLIARVSEKTPSDLEHELNEFSRKLHTKSQNLTDSFELNQKKLSELHVTQSHLAERINFIARLICPGCPLVTGL